MTQEDFKRRWRQSAQTGQGIPLAKLMRTRPQDFEAWIGSENVKNGMVTVYRGTDVPGELENGHFVTLNREYAARYGKHVIEATVPVKHLRYFGGTKKGDPSNLGGTPNYPTELIFSTGMDKFHKQYHTYDFDRFTQENGVDENAVPGMGAPTPATPDAMGSGDLFVDDPEEDQEKHRRRKRKKLKHLKEMDDFFSGEADL